MSTEQIRESECTHDRHSNRTSLLRLFSRSASVSAAVERKPARRMLTSGQLSDLFRRLDRDGNGELDLEEFSQIINKLKIKASEDFVASVFRAVDVHKNGTLNMQEFVSAYQMIFTKPASCFDSSTDKKGPPKKRKPTEFVCAIRYGNNSSGGIFQLHLGSVTEMPDGPLFLMHEKRVYSTDGAANKRLDELDYEIVPNWSANLADINEQITRDAMNNMGSPLKVFWWIDIAMVKVASHRVDKYIAGLGLPNDSKFRSSFGQFGTCLPREEKSHIYAGNGTSNMGGVSSLSLFCQSLWILGTPIVHHIPSWLDSSLDSLFSQSTKSAIMEYYFSRFAFFFRASSATSLVTEFINSCENAQIIANRLDDDRNGDDIDNEVTQGASTADSLVGSSVLTPAPLNRQSNSSWRREPTWLLSAGEIKKRPPKIQCDNLSLHILDQGHGPACCVTIREIDSEEREASPHRKNSTILEDSKLGVVGRLITGVRMKLLQNLCKDGIVSTAGELTDSPAALAAVLVTLLHSFSMNTLGTLSAWLNVIACEVDDLAVSKHSAHAKEMFTLVNNLKDYADPTLEIFESMYAEGARQRAQEALAAEEAAQAALEEEEGQRRFQSFESVDTESIGSDEHSPKHNNDKTNFNSVPPILPKRKVIIKHKSLLSRRRSGLTDKVQLSFSTLPSGCQCVPISYDIAKEFLGDDPCRNIEFVIEGDESLEVKGIKYWTEQLKCLLKDVEKVKEDIRLSLEEKRNFFSFVLTVVTVFLAPLTILTGYWGMNFDNMSELDSTYYSFAPGVKLIWVTGVVVYATFLVMSIHFRILYSAT